MDVEQSVSYYRDHYQFYERFTIKVRSLLEELLGTQGISFSTEHRTKDVEHFREKITRPGKSYTDPLHEITDLCGIRIIVRRVSDVDEVIKLIKREFNVDDNNSIYKAEELNVDQFGYTSVHLVVNLNEGRKALTEWKSFELLKVEIQVRTILQHAWAVISYSFDYKVGADIPRDFRRRLFRLSALFELADEELDQLVDGIAEKVASYKASIDVGDTRIELNIDSLRAYVETADEVRYWIEYIKNVVGTDVSGWEDISKDIRIAEFCGLKTIEEIKRVMLAARGWGESFLKEYEEKLAERYKSMTPYTLSGVVSLLIIAANAEKFTDDILQDDFGYGYSPVLEVALKTRGVAR
jgi:putative GTP pyrophosphokinase